MGSATVRSRTFARQSCSPSCDRRLSRKQPTGCKVNHEGLKSEPPRPHLIAGVDAVLQGAELSAADGHFVADEVGEALARSAAILRWRKQGAEEQHEPVGILVVLVQRLVSQVLRVAA